MSGHGHGGESEYAPSNGKKMAANLVAGLILGIGRIVYTIFLTVFRFLTALVGFL